MPLTLSPEQREQLQFRYDDASPKLQRRIQALILLAAGCTVTELARSLGVSRSTLYTWIRRFDSDGIEGLRDRPRSGRPPVIDSVLISMLRHIVDNKRPRELGYNALRWTVSLLQKFLEDERGVHVSKEYLRQLLHRNNIQLVSFHRKPRPEQESAGKPFSSPTEDNRKYPDDFKAAVLSIVEEDDRPITEIAKELGLKPWQIYKWRQRYQVVNGKLELSQKRAEEREVKQLIKALRGFDWGKIMQNRPPNLWNR